jgi:hypothetical protein
MLQKRQNIVARGKFCYGYFTIQTQFCALRRLSSDDAKPSGNLPSEKPMKSN